MKTGTGFPDFFVYTDRFERKIIFILKWNASITVAHKITDT